MKSKFWPSKTVRWVLVVLLLALAAVACRGGNYTVQYFCFPQSASIEAGTCDFVTEMRVSSSKGKIVAKNDKTISIRVKDKSHKIILDEEFEVTAASVRGKVSWKDFEQLGVEVMEVGNQFAKDPHNEALLKNGPNRLLALTYGYDVTRKAFTR